MSQDTWVIFDEIAGADGHRIGVACINSEKTLNALNIPIIARLLPQLRAWALDDGIAAVFLHAAGEKAFCAGGDVKSICVAVRANGVEDSTAFDLFSQEYRLDFLIHDYPKPLIVWGTGYVMGGGIGLLCGASHRIVTETSRLAMPEITIGLYPDVGGSWFLARLGKIGLFLGMTGAMINAADALATGFATQAVAAGKRHEVLTALAALSWGSPESRHDQVSALLDGFALTDLAAGHIEQAGAELSERLQGEELADLYAALTAPSANPWLDKAARTLKAGSPTSAALIYRQWQNGSRMSLADTFRQELILSVQCARHPDFIEGVRALLVDKDQQPRWHPATLAEVSQAWLDGHYAAPWQGRHPLSDLENWQG
ncbi:enoyl-CoA hydratase/carnithine racemase [Fluviicoccus keumensis]|uniref:3-hydroxyisobutyryl-CoA hydrolase n=1 Tax=Fluviicoccus keumensis TaxID=1435465 RepID=A0A4Q7ZAF0_9GAMM|nr:enoyl-CoA hydratase/isomerase family protein [Fluviicoccus keumensis]RZU47094.1 enoyl-CoA hydratase/carnithine racemase [Fluviicoccus keumensis]